MDKSLSISWSFDGEGGERQFHKESFDSSYWPTAASRISDERLTAGGDFLVAGKRPSNGNTVIEKWELDLAQLPAQGVSTPVQKTLVYEGQQDGKKIARTMHPVNGIQMTAFVHFDDSNDLYRIDASSGELTPLLTPAQVPSLGHDTYEFMWGGKNPAGAYVYVYQCEFSIHDDGAVILYDLDGDGGIDQWTEVASTQWSVIEALEWTENYSG